MADHDEAAKALRLIASTLGISVRQFYDGTTPGEFAEARECLRLWCELRTESERASVLDCLRQALEREAA